jgi:predicted aspartyl protease
MGRRALFTRTPGIYVPIAWIALFRPDGTEYFARDVLIDTGAGVLALPGQFARDLGVTPDPNYRFGGHLADGRRVVAHGAMITASIFGDSRELVPAYFADEFDQPMLGLQILMQRYTITLDANTKELVYTAIATRQPMTLVDAPDG